MVFSVNARAPSQLAAAAAKQSIPIIHVSTDYVFDGQNDVPYVEHDQVAPLNVYGRSKLSGEEGVRAANPQHVVLRTSWVHSPYCKNFVKTILRLAAERDRLAVVADQRGCPTAAVDIAEACLHIAINCAEGPSRAAYGTYHFSGSGEASWFEFAGAIVESASDRTGRQPQIQPIPTSEYPTPAKRPANTRLDCSAVKEKFGCDQRPWRRGLQSTIDRLLAKGNLS
jgi:dTDP-4-dehydrorhamnose reductase